MRQPLTLSRKPTSFMAVADTRRRDEARQFRARLFAQCRQIIGDLGEDASGFAMVVWDRNGELRSAYDTGHGPLRPGIIPTLAGDALNRHVALDMAPPLRADKTD
jgi:hypothetical protein